MHVWKYTKSMVCENQIISRLTMASRLWIDGCDTGPVVRIAPDEVTFSSAAAAKEIYSTGKGFHKTDYSALFPPAENPNIFTEINEEKHGVKRRMALNAYSLKPVLDSESFVDKTEICFFQRLDDLFVRWDENVEEECDLGAWLQYYAFDVRLLHHTEYTHSLMSFDS